MVRRVLLVCLLAVALAPSAWLAWHWRAMPHLGFYHDDGIYWVSAKSIAEGQGYRILSLPSQPNQTKYPPLFPAMLAAVWKLQPGFPQNLPLATLAVWLMLPPWLVLMWWILRMYQFTFFERTALCATAAINPIAVLFGFSLMSELLFSALLLSSLLLAERDSTSAVVCSGLLAGLAYLTRSAALPLLVTVPLILILRNQPRRAAGFVAGMLPFVVAWQWWVARHVGPGHDLVTLYYTNYLGFQRYNVGWADLPTVVWHNFDAMLGAIGKLLLFDVQPLESWHFERVVAVASIAGIVRLARSTRRLQYPMAALGLCLLLLVWNSQPDQRFLFPLYPLLAAGLWAELRNVASTLRIAWTRNGAERALATTGAGALAVLAVFVLTTHIRGLLHTLPELMEAHRVDLGGRLAAYAWLAHQSPVDAKVFAYQDPVLFLYTGRKSCGLPLPPRLLYYDPAGMDRFVQDTPTFARQNRLDYLLLTRGDFDLDLHERGVHNLAVAVSEDPGLDKVFSSPCASIYHVVR